ncbi:DUF1345 domain-containing protein [Nostoc sp. MS1]|uniref:DUF1345 domain-containing protein n=1 Tax=Nostoc sp. MS1 TaxID=2764711 RepID=UPI001CC74B86|nr:DUF1345 domain-containing protein [Nostoc sp. MS1]
MKTTQNNTSDPEPHQNIKSPLESKSRVLMSGLLFWHSLLSHLDSKTRLGLTIMLAMTVFLRLPNTIHLANRILTAWILGVFCFLTLVILMMCSATHQKTRYRAQRQEAQHLAVFILVVITACTSIFAIGLMQAINDSKNIPESTLALQIALSLVAVICSWFLTHTIFALHYATCYYNPDFMNEETGYVGGLDFPGDELPDYWDFMYFSFTIGMTAQTSDVSLPGSGIRRLAIGHAIISFFFYMVILASSVNVASGLI